MIGLQMMGCLIKNPPNQGLWRISRRESKKECETQWDTDDATDECDVEYTHLFSGAFVTENDEI